jgi:hypothetical protein
MAGEWREARVKTAGESFGPLGHPGKSLLKIRQRKCRIAMGLKPIAMKKDVFSLENMAANPSNYLEPER